MEQEKKESYLEKLAAKLLELDKKINELKGKTQTASTEAKGDLEEMMKNLRGKRDDINQIIQRITQSSGDGWKDLKDGAEKAFDDLKKGFQSALSRFK